MPFELSQHQLMPLFVCLLPITQSGDLFYRNLLPCCHVAATANAAYANAPIRLDKFRQGSIYRICLLVKSRLCPRVGYALTRYVREGRYAIRGTSFTEVAPLRSGTLQRGTLFLLVVSYDQEDYICTSIF